MPILDYDCIICSCTCCCVWGHTVCVSELCHIVEVFLFWSTSICLAASSSLGWGCRSLCQFVLLSMMSTSITATTSTVTRAQLKLKCLQTDELVQCCCFSSVKLVKKKTWCLILSGRLNLSCLLENFSTEANSSCYNIATIRNNYTLQDKYSIQYSVSSWWLLIVQYYLLHNPCVHVIVTEIVWAGVTTIINPLYSMCLLRSR